jgi:ATP-dependent Lon protease
MPKDNEKDIEDIPESVRRDMKFIPVEHLDQVLSVALMKVARV